MKTVGFFSSRSGVGATTLIYHLAWMYQELGIKTLVMDLDSQADLTTALLPQEDVLDLLTRGGPTIYGMLEEGGGCEPQVQRIGEFLALLPGDPNLVILEESFAWAWIFRNDSMEGPTANKLTTNFSRLARQAAEMEEAQLVLIDAGAGLNAIQRAAFLACDAVIVPLRLDPISLFGIPSLGLSLRNWRSKWKGQTGSREMEDLGYVILQDSTSSGQRLAPPLYHPAFLGTPEGSPAPKPDPYHLGTVKRYPSLLPLSHDARKPMFLLKPADGAIGSHVAAVRDCYRDFKQLALRIASACGITVPPEDLPLV